MIDLPNEYKAKVLNALFEQRDNFTGSDTKYAKQYGINPSIYSRLKNGSDYNGLIKNEEFLRIGKQLGVGLGNRTWNIARTPVFTMIEQDINHCKENSKAMMFVDEADIGKTVAAKYLSRNLKNCFYIDGSQCKKERSFIKEMARVIGISTTGTIDTVKAEIKYYLNVIPNPVVMIDEAGDLEYKAFLNIKEFWNATEGQCGWYLMGAEGLKNKFKRGIEREKVGYTEIFSRFSGKYSSITPIDRNEKSRFYRELVTTVMEANVTIHTPEQKQRILNRCIIETEGKINGLRRLDSLLILNQ